MQIKRKDCLVVIPARLASTRLPNKPLADIHGLPMIAHVWRRAVEADIGRVVVAAAETAIADAITAVGGESVLTDPSHPSGSDRIYEAIGKIDPHGEASIIVNVQGDLPTLDPGLIRQAIMPLAGGGGADIATLVCPITEEAERQRSSVVKAVVAWHPGAACPRIGRALYFSRSPVPWGDGVLLHHIGLYAYRREALERFVMFSTGELERRESLEQLRALENGMRIDAVEVFTVPLGVDTADDLNTARKLLGETRHDSGPNEDRR